MGILYIDGEIHGGNMKLRAQNTIEIITMVALVCVVVLSAFMFMQGNNTNIASLSAINTGKKNITINKEVATNSSNKINDDNNFETAGALSSTIANSTANELYAALSQKTLNDVLVSKTNDNKDIFDLADILIQENSLTISEFGSNRNIEFNDEVKSRLVNIAVQTKTKLDKEQKTSSSYDLYIDILAQIINS